MADGATSSSSSQPVNLNRPLFPMSLPLSLSLCSQSNSLAQEVTDETQDWILGAGSGWVEARTSCDHLDSLSPDLTHLPTPDTPCSRCQNPVENWLCLCCKEVLCSRFVNRHMLMHHHQQTGHCLALSYSDLSVWCFCCEAYLDAQIILQLRPIHQAAYILKFGKAPPLPQL